MVSIDLLSVKLRTFDNLFVRIPNEALLKSEIVNVTYYPIRRIDAPLSLPPVASLEKAKAVLLAVAEDMPEVLADPKPSFWVSGVSDVSVSVTLSVWVSRDASAALKTELYTRALAALNAAEVPLPVVRLHAS